MAVNLGPLGPSGPPGLLGPVGFNQQTWYQPCGGAEDGGFQIRICPPMRQFGQPTAKPAKFCLRTCNHQVGKQTFQCHKEVVDGKWQGECAICNQYNKFWKDHFDADGLLFSASSSKPKYFVGDEEDFRRELKAIKPVERYYFNIIVRGEEERGVLKWSCGKTIYAKILEGIVGNESNPNVIALGDITNPKTGHDFYVRRVMKGSASVQFPDYSTSQFLPSTPMGTPEQMQLWSTQLHDLHALRKLSSVESMMSALEEVFGYLGPENSKSKYRSLADPFEPAW